MHYANVSNCNVPALNANPILDYAVKPYSLKPKLMSTSSSEQTTYQEVQYSRKGEHQCAGF